MNFIIKNNFLQIKGLNRLLKQRKSNAKLELLPNGFWYLSNLEEFNRGIIENNRILKSISQEIK